MQHVDQFAIGGLNLLVVANDRAVLGHERAQFAPEEKRILAAVRPHQAGIDFFLALALGVEVRVGIAASGLQILGVLHGIWARNEASKDARHQRIRAEAIVAMVLVFGLARGEDARNICTLSVIHPQSAHTAVYARAHI